MRANSDLLCAYRSNEWETISSRVERFAGRPFRCRNGAVAVEFARGRERIWAAAVAQQGLSLVEFAQWHRGEVAKAWWSGPGE